ncbi:hypothetical protein [Nocardia sp. NBC_00403]|uniref:hypothetical protein n=1 Tax=Nocardia sp. NBC_00403 TaxID=2975990 RepID=UPI002E23844E
MAKNNPVDQIGIQWAQFAGKAGSGEIWFDPKVAATVAAKIIAALEQWQTSRATPPQVDSAYKRAPSDCCRTRRAIGNPVTIKAAGRVPASKLGRSTTSADRPGRSSAFLMTIDSKRGGPTAL